MDTRQEIVRLAKLCMKPTHPWKEDLVRALIADFGFSSLKSRSVINSMFARFSDRALIQYVKNNKPLYKKNEKIVGFVFPSNVPDPLVEDVFLALIEEKVCYIKLSKRATAWGVAFLNGIRRESSMFRYMLRWTMSKEEFFNESKRFDVVCSYGEASSIDMVRKALRKRIRFRAFGPRLSFGIIFNSALKGVDFDDVVRQSALDVYWYDQRGCLSPQIFFVEGSSNRFAKSLADELAVLNEYFGYIDRSYTIARSRSIFIDRWVAGYLGKRGITLINKLNNPKVPVVAFLDKEHFAPGPAGQVVAVKRFGSLSDIYSEMKPFKSYIQGVSISGKPNDAFKASKMLKNTSVSYISNAGLIQCPPLGWNRGAD